MNKLIEYQSHSDVIFHNNDQMKRLLLFFFKTIRSLFLYRPKAFLYLLRHKELYIHQTYFPEEKKRTSTLSIFGEQLSNIIKYGGVNKFYFPYGFDVKSKLEKEEYVDYLAFMLRRDELNIGDPSNHTCILRNKLLFSIVANGFGVKTAKNLLLVNRGEVTSIDPDFPASLGNLLNMGNAEYFCKLVDGECGIGIFMLEVKNGNFFVNDKTVSIPEFIDYCGKGVYLIQEVVRQHDEMKALHPSSLNTLRLVTVKSLKDGAVHLLPSILRIGTGDSIVDNTSRGGIAVGIDIERGTLKKYGFYKPEFGLKTTVHPDSNITFEGYKIPFFNEAKEMALKFHSLINVHSVGWDVAITPDGPVFIEGNDNWEINGPQICNGGLRKEFEQFFFRPL